MDKDIIRHRGAYRNKTDIDIDVDVEAVPCVYVCKHTCTYTSKKIDIDMSLCIYV